MSQTFSRREALKTGAAASAFAGVTILASKKTLAQRQQKLIYWHLPTFTPLADDASSSRSSARWRGSTRARPPSCRPRTRS
jgi:hypothetical protein